MIPDTREKYCQFHFALLCHFANPVLFHYYNAAFHFIDKEFYIWQRISLHFIPVSTSLRASGCENPAYNLKFFPVIFRFPFSSTLVNALLSTKISVFPLTLPFK